jgi:capsular polysaccharide biosynthesis protein
VLALIAAASAYVLSVRQTPEYQAKQFILIQPARTDLGLTDALIQLLNSYEVYLNSTVRAQEVIDDLKLDMLASDLLSKATIVANRDNLTVEIDVVLPDGPMAANVAREWGNLLVLYRNEDNQKLQQADRVNATLPDIATYSLYSPHPPINAAAGAILGLLLGGIIIFVLEYLESSIVRRREDIERALDLPVLAIIPDLER